MSEINSNNKSDNRKKLYLYPVFLLGAILGLYLLSMREGSPAYAERRTYLFLLAPALAGFAVNILRRYLLAFLTGRLIEVLSGVLTIFGWGMAGFLFFLLMPDAYPLNQAGFWIMAMTVLWASFRFLPLLSGHIILLGLLRAFLLLLLGITGSMMMYTFWQNGQWDLGIMFSAGDMVLAGYFMLSAASLLALLEMSEYETLKSVGRWFATGNLSKFLYGAGAVFLFKDIRTALKNAFPGNYIFVEWIVLFLILLTAFLYIRGKLAGITSETYTSQLSKHIQSISYSKDDEFSEVSAYIDDFIKRGEKGKLTTYLIINANKADIPHDTISRVIKPLLNYSDERLPAVLLRKELKLIQERNEKVRFSVLDNIIKEIKFYGGR